MDAGRGPKDISVGSDAAQDVKPLGIVTQALEWSGSFFSA